MGFLIVAGQKRPSQATPPPANSHNLEESKLEEFIERLKTLLKPSLEFSQPDEQMTADDVVFSYSVRAIRGKDTLFKQVQGTSPLNRLLATDRLMDASQRVELEMKDKIVIPMVGAFQDYVNRIALDLVAVDRKARAAADDLTDNDLR